jgi:glycosyltransferase involved in cell wall biosynthesis
MIYDRGLLGRVLFILKKFDIDLKQGPATEMAGLELLIKFVDKNNLNKTQVYILLFQVLLCRIPTSEEILFFKANSINKNSLEIINLILEGVEYHHLALSSLHEYSFGEFDYPLLVDVTHTLDYPHNSGIQRVVRSLAKNLNDLTNKVNFLKLDCQAMRVIQLEPKEKDRLFDWHLKFLPYKHPLREITENIVGIKLSNRIRKLYYKFKLNYLTHSMLKFISLFGFSRPSQITEKRIVFIWDQHILIPELVAEPCRVNIWSFLLKNLNLKSSLILYDLIPIYYPEFCVVSEQFTHYLRLLRHIDRVSCISHAVEVELGHFVKNIPRQRPLRTMTHHLGSDFNFHHIIGTTDDKTEQEKNKSTPMVLCVGTIEPRKNNIKILEAAKILADRKIKFKLVFAGNPGWLNEVFFKLLNTYQSSGVNVEYIKSPSDFVLNELYSSAVCTVFVSLAEGFGLPIIESVMKGTPCITSNMGCMLEISSQIGGCLNVNPESAESIAEEIKSLLLDKKKQETLRKQCQNAKWTTWREYASGIYKFISD